MLRVPALALLLITGLIALQRSASADSKFAPNFTVTLTHAEPEVPSDLTLQFSIELGEYQFAGVAFYLPLEWGVAPGDSLAVGAQVGKISSVETFGLINSGCNVPLLVEFDLLNATLDKSVPVSFGDSEQMEGVDPDTPGFGTADFAEDLDGNGLPGAVDRYPDFLAMALGEAQPLVRLAAVPPIAGVPALVQLLVFKPGTQFENELRYLSAAPELGFPVVAMIDHWGTRDDAHEPSPITDHCSPLEASIDFRAPSAGPSLLTNPQSGVYQFKFWALSKGDADADGFENYFDVCPFEANSGNPAIPEDGDADGDGMDAGCDPNDDPLNAGRSTDQDGDGYLNRQDNCPLIRNGQTDANPPGNQIDRDLDDIGDACDPDPDVPDGAQILFAPTAEVIIGDASGSGDPPHMAACPQCYRPDGAGDVSDDGTSGRQLGVAIGLITLGVGAGVVVLGGGATYLMRRRRS
jgi:hypothetical protein